MQKQSAITKVDKKLAKLIDHSELFNIEQKFSLLDDMDLFFIINRFDLKNKQKFEVVNQLFLNEAKRLIYGFSEQQIIILFDMVVGHHELYNFNSFSKRDVTIINYVFCNSKTDFEDMVLDEASKIAQEKF